MILPTAALVEFRLPTEETKSFVGTGGWPELLNDRFRCDEDRPPRPRGADCDRSGLADLHAALPPVAATVGEVLPAKMERGVITIDESPSDEDRFFFHDEEEEEETNVKIDSTDGPNSGFMDVDALRIRVRMEMLSLVVAILLFGLVQII